MPNRTSHHILGTSANLLGFCLVVLTSLHLTNHTENSILDELTSIVALLLVLSSLLSFAAIRIDKDSLSYRLEKLAEVFFFGSLISISGIIVFIMISYWDGSKP